MNPHEVLAEVAYTALTVAMNSAMALAEHGLMTEENARLTAAEMKKLAATLEQFCEENGEPDALPAAQAVRLQAAARALERLCKGR